MKIITVVIPCYNAEKYIKRCLNSLEGQSFKQFGVIIVDDASTDDTVKIVKQVQDEYSFEIQLIENDQNSGPALSRNVAIKIAKTEYITFCDCDDWYDTDYLWEMINLIRSTKSEIAFCGYKVVDNNGHEEIRPVIEKEMCFSGKDALCLNVDSLCMMLVKTEFMKSVMLPDLRNGEDMAVIPVLIFKSSKCAVTNKCLYNYYRNNESASQRSSIDMLNSLQISFEFIRNNLPDKYISEVEYIGIRNYLYVSVMTIFSIRYDKTEVKKRVSWFEKDYCYWYRNKYIKKMPKYKKIVVFCINYRMYRLLYVIAIIRKILTGRK